MLQNIFKIKITSNTVSLYNDTKTGRLYIASYMHQTYITLGMTKIRVQREIDKCSQVLYNNVSVND